MSDAGSSAAGTSAGSPPPITVLYADGDVLAVAKPEGLPAIPERDLGRPCLVQQLSAQIGDRLWVVHRLDKDVSGVMLFARSAAAHRHLNAQFASRRIHKTYLALTHGEIVAEVGRIDRPLRVFGSGRIGVDEQRGRPSVTDFEVSARAGGFTLVTAHPVTGRPHQLRVHFHSMGHPLVGDRRYGDRAVQAAFPRLMLHALRLSCQLPSGGPLTVTAPVPSTFVEALAGLTGLAAEPEGTT